MEKAPILFLGHGSPMNIIFENEYTSSLVQLGQSIPTPKAILIVLAHWLTQNGSMSMRCFSIGKR